MNFKCYLQNHSLFVKSKYQLDFYSGINTAKFKILIFLLVRLNLIIKKLDFKLKFKNSIFKKNYFRKILY